MALVDVAALGFDSGLESAECTNDLGSGKGKDVLTFKLHVFQGPLSCAMHMVQWRN